MIYGFIFGVGGIISFIYTNNQLQKKYYCELANKTDQWKISPDNTDALNDTSDWFPLTLSKYNKKKYTKIQKQHYFFTIIMFIMFNTMAFELFFNGYTKLHLINKDLIYMPIDIIFCHFVNSSAFYFYHRFAHTKYYYKYIHSYHHAFYNPEPFDSLIGHPLDHTCAAILQVLPMFIYRMHLISFLIYSSILSVMGIYDHSGIKHKINYLKHDSLDHHIHHLYPSKNYGAGFPILIWDRLFGSYK
jgi:sterol desaturase/sphingolipid hydroxylase (fatty acid hydroxylase superfamily)